MLCEDWPLDRIRPYPNNPRVMRNAAEKVADSLREFGPRQPIVVDDDGVVIIGHTRLAAAKLLKWATFPVHVAVGMTADQVRALRIADNKTSEFASWDDAKLHDELAAILEGLGTIEATGFSQSEFDAIEMQARAEMDRFSQPATPPAAPALPTEPQDPNLGDDGAPDVEDATLPDDDQPDGGGHADSAPAAQDMVPFTALMPIESRDVLFDAINRAKKTHGLQQTADALVVIARSYLSA